MLRKIALNTCSFIFFGGLLCCGQRAFCQQARKMNVLFIIIDDLRPTLGCFGDPVAITPHIDKIASRGTVFERAYCQQAVCNPSRASFLTGLRPNTTRVWNLSTHFRKALPDVVTLPQWFKNHGYFAQAIGKIYHDPASMQDPQSWSVPEILGVTTQTGKYVLDSNLNHKGSWKSTATERADAPEEAYIDGLVGDAAVKVLERLKDTSFFLAVGFRRPHLPFSAPEKYWKLYDGKVMPVPSSTKPPAGVPPVAMTASVELRGYTDVPDKGPLSYRETQKLIQGYYAATSFTDHQVGKLYDKLKQLDLLNNTIIVIVGDNGYHLGDQDIWCKATDFEAATRVPLIMAVPGQQVKGAKSRALVELVDMYPTLIDLEGQKVPGFLEGYSMKPLLNNPGLSWKKAAFSQFPRPWPYKKTPSYMGYTIRTENYRFTEWIDEKTRQVTAMELYDHRKDPGESVNEILNASYRETVKKLRTVLENGWKMAEPARAAITGR